MPGCRNNKRDRPGQFEGSSHKQQIIFGKLLFLISLIWVSPLCNVSFGVSLKVDVGVCGPTQHGWIPLRAARGRLNENVGGTNIDVIIAAGADSKAKGGECRCDSGSTHELAAVETTYIKKDARRNARSPRTDIRIDYKWSSLKALLRFVQ